MMAKKDLNPLLSEAQFEALKELGRLIVLSAISYLLTEGGTALLVNIVTVDPSTQLLLTGMVTAILRTIDKWMHEKGKNEGDKALEGGIVRF